MKDKEKALEIANKQKKYYGNPQYEMSKENFSASECFKSAMEMAQWKEKQMIEKMENFVKRLYLPAYPYQDRENEELINDIKEAMLEEE